MTVSDLFGWAAAALTLLTFASRDPCRARLLALSANACFIGYGVTGGPLHTLALHLSLVPLNLMRVVELKRRASPSV